MRKKFFILTVIAVLVVVYFLNREYSRIYEYNGKVLVSPYKSASILITKSGSVKNLTYVSLGDSLSSRVGSDDYKKTLPYVFAEDLSKKANVYLQLFRLV